MSCCGQNRTAPLTKLHRMKVCYYGGRPIIIKGPVTGSEYHFSGIDRLQLIDPRDAVVIARDHLFRIEGVAWGGI